MSDSSQTLVDIEATPAQAKRSAKSVLSALVKAGIVEADLSDCALDEQGHTPGPNARTKTKGKRAVGDLETNGLEIIVGRTAFDTGGNGVELMCPGCKKTFDPGDGYMDAADAWYQGEDDVEFACPKCGRSQPLTEWDGPRAMGFGNLGLKFWNWPELTPGFVKELAELPGRRVRVVGQHL